MRVGLNAPSGAGKTYSALLLARGIASDWSKVALIDTENGSGELYSHLGPYNVLTLEAPFSPERYVEAIKAVEAAGMEVLVIDSVTHEWDGKGGMLESNDLLAHTRFKGNTWAAWSVSTPRHQKFIEAITTSPLHIITTARSKTDTIQVDGKVKKLGMKEIQREGFEYELTLNFSIEREGHYATASKDRTGLFIDKDPFIITEQTGKQLRAWCETGVPALKTKTPLETLLEKVEQATGAQLVTYLEKLNSSSMSEEDKKTVRDAIVAKMDGGQPQSAKEEIADLTAKASNTLKPRKASRK